MVCLSCLQTRAKLADMRVWSLSDAEGCRRRGGKLCLVCWAWKTPQPLVSLWEARNLLLRNLCSRHSHISLNSALFNPAQVNTCVWLAKISMQYSPLQLFYWIMIHLSMILDASQCIASIVSYYYNANEQYLCYLSNMIVSALSGWDSKVDSTFFSLGWLAVPSVFSMIAYFSIWWTLLTWFLKFIAFSKYSKY